MTGWLEDLANGTVFIFKTLKEIKLCKFLHSTMEAQGASADSSNCHTLHALLGNSITYFKTSRNQKMKLTC
jgi:DNA polymerase III delta subunit